MRFASVEAMRSDAEGVRAAQRERWAAGRVARLPSRWQGRMLRIHAEMLRASGDFEANSWLRETSAEFGAYRIDPAASDDDIRALAASCALEAFNHATGWATGLGIPCGDVADVRRRMGEYCRRWGVEPPDGCKVEDRPAVSRMTCAGWWRRQLRRVQARGVEGAAIRLGYVHRRADLYASEEAVARRREQKARNAAAMAATELENEEGDRYTLDKLAALSVANPRIRRGELMVRISGFEACARGLGHAGEFVTVTCPSRFHARLSPSGAVNPKYDGSTPKDAQGYLVGLWAKCRAALARRGIAVYGFRIAEPHHDGCPHWHLLLFMQAENVPEFRLLLSAYALADSREEAGATVNRVKFVSIDWQRGTAAGYIAKYVSKNIDGSDVGLDFEGRPAVESAVRVDAWASTWGIRQFQQIGGPPVGLWREARRLEACPEAPALDALRMAAGDTRAAVPVKPDWSRFVDLLGGPLARRKDCPAGVVMVGREGLNQYGEVRGLAPYGVACYVSGEVVKSKRSEWRHVGQGQAIGAGERADMREHAARLLRSLRRASGRSVGSFFDSVVMGGGYDIRCNGACGAGDGVVVQQGEGEKRAAGDGGGNGRVSGADGFDLVVVGGFDFQAGPAGPWSPVNNCTGVGDGKLRDWIVRGEQGGGVFCPGHETGDMSAGKVLLDWGEKPRRGKEGGPGGSVGTEGAPDRGAGEIRVGTDGGPGDGRPVRRAAH